MRHFTDSTLNALDRLSGKFGPLSSLISVIAERIAPTVTAQACGGVFCFATCSPILCSNGSRAHFRYYASSEANCDASHYNCDTVQCIC
jgi:hypothetical protein